MEVIAIEINQTKTNALCDGKAIVLSNPKHPSVTTTVNMIEKCLEHYCRENVFLVVSVDYELYQDRERLSNIIINRNKSVQQVLIYPTGYGLIYGGGSKFIRNTMVVMVDEFDFHCVYYNMGVARKSIKTSHIPTPEELRAYVGRDDVQVVVYGDTSCIENVCTQNNTYIVLDRWVNLKGLYKKGVISNVKDN